MGMVSECCCKEVYIIIIDILIIINTFPYSTCINSFFGSIIPISLFIFKCFFVLYNEKQTLGGIWWKYWSIWMKTPLHAYAHV